MSGYRHNMTWYSERPPAGTINHRDIMCRCGRWNPIGMGGIGRSVRRCLDCGLGMVVSETAQLLTESLAFHGFVETARAGMAASEA